jgi:hypothetical protein
MPHSPQLLLSAVRSTHTPAQLVSVPGQLTVVASLASGAPESVSTGVEQTPSTQTSPDAQSVSWLQAPEVEQTPLRQTWPEAQSVSWVQPPGPASGGTRVPVHVPEVQTPPGAQSASEVQLTSGEAA